MQECRVCKRRIQHAKTCPHCGCAEPMKRSHVRWPFPVCGGGLIVLAAVLVWWTWPTTQPSPKLLDSPPIDVIAIEREQARCQEIIDKYFDDGVFSRVELRGLGPRLWVTARFDDLDDDTKRKCVAAVQAYHATKTPGADKVTLYKVGSGEKIGHHTGGPDGLTLY